MTATRTDDAEEPASPGSANEASTAPTRDLSVDAGVPGPGGTWSLDETETFDPAAVAALDDSPEPRPEEETRVALPSRVFVGRYELIEAVGRGGMGVVYAAHDPELDRRVALKLVREDLAGSRLARDRLIQEAQAAARLAHPHLIRIYDAGAVGRRFYVAMEWIDGLTLDAWARERPRSRSEIVALFGQLAEGLQAVHDSGLVHRDIKPSNLMVDRAGRAVVVDFGLARTLPRVPTDQPDSESEPDSVDPEVDPEVDAKGEDGDAGLPASAIPVLRTRLRGTRGYVSPEQLRGEPVDARCDQFAFAVVLFEIVYGHRPFDSPSESGSSSSARLIEEALESIEAGPQGWVGAVPKADTVASDGGGDGALWRVLERALSPDPNARFDSVTGFHRAVEQALSGAAAPTDGGPDPARVEAKVEGEVEGGAAVRRRWPRALAASALVVAATGALLLAIGVGWPEAAGPGKPISVPSPPVQSRSGAAAAEGPSSAAPSSATARLPSPVGDVSSAPGKGPEGKPGQSADTAGNGAQPRPEVVRSVYDLLNSGKFAEAATAAKEVQRAAEREGQRSVVAEALLLEGVALTEQGEDDVARPLLDRAVELAYAAGDDALLTEIAINMIIYSVRRRDFEDGRFWIGLATAAVERQGNPPRLVGQLLFARSRLERAEGQRESMIASLEGMLELGLEDSTLVRSAHGLLLRAWREEGNLVKAEGVATAWLEILRQEQGPLARRTIDVESAIVELAMMAGEDRRALELADAILGRAVEPESWLYFSLRLDRAEILHRSGESALARAEVDGVLELAERFLAETRALPEGSAGAQGEYARERTRNVVGRAQELSSLLGSDSTSQGDDPAGHPEAPEENAAWEPDPPR